MTDERRASGASGESDHAASPGVEAAAGEEPGDLRDEALPAALSTQVRTLLDGSFLDRRENVLAFGNPGSGKTHLVCAIGVNVRLKFATRFRSIVGQYV